MNTEEYNADNKIGVEYCNVSEEVIEEVKVEVKEEIEDPLLVAEQPGNLF